MHSGYDVTMGNSRRRKLRKPSSAKIKILRLLWKSKDSPTQVSAYLLCKKLKLAKGTVDGIIKQLKRYKFITLTEMKSNETRRSIRSVRLTPEGVEYTQYVLFDENCWIPTTGIELDVESSSWQRGLNADVIVCTYCKGSGTLIRGNEVFPCNVCFGIGNVGIPKNSHPCQYCRSTGRDPYDKQKGFCPACKGIGFSKMRYVIG